MDSLVALMTAFLGAAFVAAFLFLRRKKQSNEKNLIAKPHKNPDRWRKAEFWEHRQTKAVRTQTKLPKLSNKKQLQTFCNVIQLKSRL